jgi:polar amino acid transport system permease protein
VDLNALLPKVLGLGDQGYGDEMLWGALRSVEIAFFAYALGFCIGILGASGKLYGPKWLRGLLDAYTTVVRSVPDLVLILLLYYAGTDGLNSLLLSMGIGPLNVNGLVAAVFVLGFVQGAFSTEVLRAAIQAVPVGQIEAARAYGMSGWKQFERVIFPAMLPNALPGLANLWVNVIKSSALISIVGYTELALATRQAAGNSKQYLLLYVAAQVIYLAITLFTVRLFTWAEVRLRYGQPKLA